MSAAHGDPVMPRRQAQIARIDAARLVTNPSAD